MAGGISEHRTVVRMKCMPACLLLLAWPPVVCIVAVWMV